jgi:hypothetical protein
VAGSVPAKSRQRQRLGWAGVVARVVRRPLPERGVLGGKTPWRAAGEFAVLGSCAAGGGRQGPWRPLPPRYLPLCEESCKAHGTKDLPEFFKPPPERAPGRTRPPPSEPYRLWDQCLAEPRRACSGAFRAPLLALVEPHLASRESFRSASRNSERGSINAFLSRSAADRRPPPIRGERTQARADRPKSIKARAGPGEAPPAERAWMGLTSSEQRCVSARRGPSSSPDPR